MHTTLLAEFADPGPGVVQAEQLRTDAARSAQELVWHGMAARVQLILGGSRPGESSRRVSWHNLTMHLRIGDHSVRVIALEQRDVYADVIEGVPDAQINASIVADALARAAHRYGGSPYLVPPRVRPLRSRDKEALPRVCCIARVRGGPPRDPAADHGEACLVWFQDEIMGTIASNVAERLDRLAWGDIATDVHW